MNYRHAYHAGNFADVVKHVALAAVLLHLRKKDKPFRVIDTHAGRGLYDLTAGEAARTAEAQGGIARLVDLDTAQVPPSLAAYLDCVRAEGEGRYPGSPRLAARLLRAQDRLVAIEKHPEEEAALVHSLAPFTNAKTVRADGYERLPALLPPPERRGLVLIDPPYEAPDEFANAAALLARAHRRFATGTYVLWFPLKSKPAADALCGEIVAHGIKSAARVDIAVDGEQSDGRLSSAGLLVVNPPYGFGDEMRAVAHVIAPRLGRNAPAQISTLDVAAL
ncbi:MAG: 23S rRNA (adenine(2030)-N(6))-methyltransferase RlmJ [Rhizomicrobium sp.]